MAGVAAALTGFFLYVFGLIAEPPKAILFSGLEPRDATDPGKDWDKHVAAIFRRSVHSLSRRRDELGRAQFVSLELGPTIEQVTPGPHSWKKALWAVHGSRVTFVVDGRTRTLSVHEMVAWRGAWYVTRLR